jgi:hypothetical protein
MFLQTVDFIGNSKRTNKAIFYFAKRKKECILDEFIPRRHYGTKFHKRNIHTNIT